MQPARLLRLIPNRLEAAKAAAAGFGTANGSGAATSLSCGQQTQFGDTQQFGRGGGRFGGRRGIDKESLKQISAMTGGSYYAATSARELEAVFAELPKYLITIPGIGVSIDFRAAGLTLFDHHSAHKHLLRRSRPTWTTNPIH